MQNRSYRTPPGTDKVTSLDRDAGWRDDLQGVQCSCAAVLPRTGCNIARLSRFNIKVTRKAEMRAGFRATRPIDGIVATLGKVCRLALFLLCVSAGASPTERGLIQLNETGRILMAGRSTPYIVRHLPIASFPQIPTAIQEGLSRRGCLIPQTYEAHRPENVIHGSFERAGSSDWAVLCSVRGTASLLVFFGSNPEHPYTLASAQETERLQAHDPTGVLGFNWGIDAASPRQVYDAQAGMHPRPHMPNHDSVGDSIVEHTTEYHYYSNGAWTLLPMPH